jgi:type I restriction-modification system DNA methylase subunit
MPSLFHARLLREHLARHVLPMDEVQRRKELGGWIQQLKSGALAKAKEVTLQGQFLTSVFGTVLGYRVLTKAAADGAYDLAAELPLGPFRSKVDGAVGFFGPDRRYVVAPLELKGASQALDTRKGRDRNPVQQAMEYASMAPESRWILVSNYDETRLYSKARGWDAYEVFRLEELASEAGFRRFHGLLSREVMLGPEPGRKSLLDELLEEGASQQQDVTEKLYGSYRDLRRDLFDDLCRRHSNLPPLDLLPLAQTILDRILFCAFAEKRGLIRRDTLVRAIDSSNDYDPDWTRWKALRGVFDGVDRGNPILGLPALNGGLFRKDEAIDSLEVGDDICERFKEIAAYDFAEDVSVEVLGHIFEQSVSDLEELRAEASEGRFEDTQRKPSKRRATGVFYTPSFITRFLVDLTLGETFNERREAAFASIYSKGVRTTTDRDLEAWGLYRESLRSLRVIDPACGSGAFLIAAFEALEREYDRVNRAMARLRGGQIEVFDLTTSVLNENLFGLDLNGESVEITKLSLWLKTARRDHSLTYLDRNIRRGNSVVDDARVDPYAFDWKAGRTAETLLERPASDAQAKAIDARWREGFDVALGNPPYVRHELLGRFKSHWHGRFVTYDGVADLFVYFFERGISELKPGGRLGFIVSNKWLRAGYAEKLRAWLASRTLIERIADFGHAPIFPDADAFPCIITVRKPMEGETVPADHVIAMTQFPREQLHKSEVPVYVETHTEPLPQSRLVSSGWSLATGDDDALWEKIKLGRPRLADFAKVNPLNGIKTGLNEAFLVDSSTRDRLVAEDPACGPLMKKYLRGQDVARWVPEWDGKWLIQLQSSGDHVWPWSAKSDDQAEDAFEAAFPSLHAFMKPHEAALKLRTDKGRYWWELRSCAYYDEFTKPKIVYQEIQFHPSYALDESGALLNNKAFMLTNPSPWLLAVLNSPLMWWFNWRFLPHMKDEALSPTGEKVQEMPIAEPTAPQATAAKTHVDKLVQATRTIQQRRASVLDWLRMEHGVVKPGNVLSDLTTVGGDAFVSEVLERRNKKTRGAITPAGQAILRKTFEEEVVPLQGVRAAMKGDERAVSRLVISAYGLTKAEEQLLWDTAPPRMPDAR